MASVVEPCLQKDIDALPIELRQRICRSSGCGKVFFICRSCDRGHGYCSQECRHLGRLAQRRKSNRIYQQSLAAKLDHADRQRAYIQRQKLKKVTGQGSGQGDRSASMAAGPESFENEHRPVPEQVLYETPADSDLGFCVICGRSGLPEARGVRRERTPVFWH